MAQSLPQTPRGGLQSAKDYPAATVHYTSVSTGNASWHDKDDPEGQVTIPKRLRDRHGLKPGSDVDFELTEGGRAFLKARHRRRARSPGCVQWWAPDSGTSSTFTISS
jgi:AbrB family looped-hinge helix DNA binding protein